MEEWVNSNEKRLKPLKRRIYIKKLASVDTEDNSEGKLKQICFYNGKNFWVFKSRFKFIKFLLEYKTKGKLFVCATNLEYDIVNMFRHYWDMVELFYGGRLIFAKLKDKKIYFMDTLNHYNFGIKEQGERIGLPKLEMDTNNPEYVKRDAEICLNHFKKYQVDINKHGAEVNYTIASSTLNGFKRNHLLREFKKMPDNILTMHRKAYYGGRVEIFNMVAEAKGSNKIYSYDINSLYPYVMKVNQYPIPDSYYVTHDIPAYGVVYCEIEYLKNVYIPFFPYRSFEGKLLFPLGRLKGWWSVVEIKYGLSEKLIKVNKVYKAIGFREVDYVFTSFVDYYYQQRLNAQAKGDKFGSDILKIYMNSLYGKFGEKIESKTIFTQDGELIESFLDKVYFPPHTNYIMALYTTAYARILLYKGLNQVLLKGGLLLYCDTDGIQYKGKEGLLPVSKKLGDYKLIGVYKKADFLLPKTYILTDFEGNEYVRVKGVPSEHRLEFIMKGFAEFLKPIRLRESLKRIDKDSFGANYWVTQTKQLKANYTKRKIIQGSKNTEPICICDF